MSFLPLMRPKYQYSKTRFFEREHGVEFLKFELDQMKAFSEAKNQASSEVSGYVSWYRPPYFLLLPTTTTPNGYIICKVENEIYYPDLNQYSTVRGKWQVDIIRNKPVKVLYVTEIQKSKLDFGIIKPDIKPKEFLDIMFENWRNVRDTTQKLIAQSFVSSPTTLNQRVGGFTLTLANYSKKNALSMFMGDLKRFIPTDFTKNISLSFKVPELGITSNLPKFGWDDNVVNLENISRQIDEKLERIPKSINECSITLLQKTMGPLNFDLRGIVKSDYPIVLEEYVERKRIAYDVDPEIYKFVLATRMSSPTISLDTYNKGLAKSRETLERFSKVHETLEKRVGNNQFLDLGHKGKPLSIHNFALSVGRANSSKTITLDEIADASQLYLDNLDTVMEVQELWGYDKIPAAATMSFTERRVYLFLDEYRESTMEEVRDSLQISQKDAQKAIDSLLVKCAIIEPTIGRYSSVPGSR